MLTNVERFCLLVQVKVGIQTKIMGYLLAALFGGVLFFNSQATPKRAAHAMEDALRRQYPDRQINVQVEGKSGMNVVRGKFKVVRLQMSGGQNKAATDAPSNDASVTPTNDASVAPSSGLSFLPIAAVAKAKRKGHIGQMVMRLTDFELNGLQVESADVTWNDVVYDFDALRKTNKLNLVKTGPASAHVIVAASSLQTLIAQRVKDIQDPKLSLQNGRIIIAGTRAAPFFGTLLPFTMSARPSIRNGTQIWLSEAQVNFSGVALPSATVNAMAEKLNPVYTFEVGETWPFAMNITRLNAQNNKLEIFADLTFIPATTTATAKPTPRATPIPSPTPAANPTPTPVPMSTPMPEMQPA